MLGTWNNTDLLAYFLHFYPCRGTTSDYYGYTAARPIVTAT